MAFSVTVVVVGIIWGKDCAVFSSQCSPAILNVKEWNKVEKNERGFFRDKTIERNKMVGINNLQNKFIWKWLKYSLGVDFATSSHVKPLIPYGQMQLQLGPINPPFWQTKLVLHLPVNQKKIANLLTSLQMQYNAITHYVIWSVLSIYMYQVLADNSCDKHRLKFTDFSTHNCYPVNHKWHSTYQMLQTLLCINHILPYVDSKRVFC